MKYDAIVVLGGGVDKKGNLTNMFLSRLKKTLELFKRNLADKIIVSGKWSGLYKFVPAKTEAEAALEYLVENGIPKDKIIKEEKSLDTIGNAFFTKKNILEKRVWTKILVVTSDFHLKRAKYIFNFILGPLYKIDFEISKGKTLGEEWKEIRKKEEEIFLEIMKYSEGIEPGDDNEIEDLLRTKHPFYKNQ
jgi:uncharacterized SAM-binding protein YcdF (DUF218 family)